MLEHIPQDVKDKGKALCLTLFKALLDGKISKEERDALLSASAAFLDALKAL